MITRKSSLLGTGQAHADQINNLVWSQNPKAPALGALYVAHARATGVVTEIAAGQMIHETSWLTHDDALDRHNPAGLMGKHGLLRFPTWYEGVAAHCQTLRKYATPGTVFWELQMKRTGSAGTLRDMAHVWAPLPQPRGVPGGDAYADAVANLANRILAQGKPEPPGIANHWAEPEIRIAMSRGWLRGEPDGYIWPDRPLSRAELATLLSRVVPPPHVAPYNLPLPRDVPPGHWAAEAIKKALDNAWMMTDVQGLFHPEDPASRAEIAVALYQAGAEAVTRRSARAFPDVQGHPYSGYVAAAYERGWMSGYPDGLFRPDHPLLRGEMAVVLARIYAPGSTAIAGTGTEYVEAAWVWRDRMWVPASAVPTVWSVDDTLGASIQLQPPDRVSAVPVWGHPAFWLAIAGGGLLAYAALSGR